MGLGQVRGTCLVLSVVKTFQTSGAGLNHQRFWAHSAHTGMVAQQLWRLSGRGASGEGYQNVYVCGLLHDVGLLVLDQFFPEEFGRNVEAARSEQRELWVVEDEILGMDHGEIGGLLLGRWSLPDVVSEAVSKHHRPAQATDDASLLCDFVHASEVISTRGPLSGEVEGVPVEEASDAREAIGFEAGDLDDILDGLSSLEEEASRFAGMAS
jgi:HD-like signal output (HDOD) protein